MKEEVGNGGIAHGRRCVVRHFGNWDRRPRVSRRRLGLGVNGEFTFHHGGVSVPDLEAAIAWYGRVLGFKLERRFYIAPAKTNVAMIRKGPLRIELFEPEEGLPLPESRRHPREDIQTHGNKHLAFRVDDLEAFMAELTAGGTEIVFVVNEQFGLGCFVRDCAGNLIEFVAEPIA